ncbi:hypothetical protein E2C01_048285 [Portunus trituberculatus]|uniref:Uncharacterized protein n=1 Tax=Portunus trituberculatus TaxID=210409 RepID=A0A5B7GCX3_PORTR|nr:hypothetical protein [Portunus trituberculatus]
MYICKCGVCGLARQSYFRRLHATAAAAAVKFSLPYWRPKGLHNPRPQHDTRFKDTNPARRGIDLTSHQPTGTQEARHECGMLYAPV